MCFPPHNSTTKITGSWKILFKFFQKCIITPTATIFEKVQILFFFRAIEIRVSFVIKFLLKKLLEIDPYCSCKDFN